MAGRDWMKGLLVALTLMGGALALKLAYRTGMVDALTVTRGFGAAMGLMVSYYGNAIPKAIGRSRGMAADARWQAALRLSGWAFVLAGLIYAALSLLEPLPHAQDAAMGAVALAVVVSLFASLRCAFGGARAAG